MAPVKPSKSAGPTAGPSGSTGKATSSSSGASAKGKTNLPPARLAKNPRLPATMFPIPAPGAALPTGAAAGAPVPTAPAPAQAPGKKTKTPPASRKKRLKSEQGKEKALEREAVLAEKVKGREDRKAKRNRAKKAWE